MSMAEGHYHKKVKKAIIEIGKESSKKFEVHKEEPIPIAHPYEKRVLHYKPEVYFLDRNRRYIIFEVLDDQAKDYNLVISDIMQSIMVRNTRKVVFIVKNKKDYDTVDDCVSIIKIILKKLGVLNGRIPELLVYEITKTEARTKKNLFRILRRYGKKDKWL